MRVEDRIESVWNEGSIPSESTKLMRVRGVGRPRLAHNQEIVSSNLSPATNCRRPVMDAALLAAVSLPGALPFQPRRQIAKETQ